MKKMVFCALVILLTAFSSSPAFAFKEYCQHMKRDLVRGAKNVLSFPLEIPITMQEYHEGPGWPLARQLAGAGDGLIQATARLGSGVWDFLAAFIPGAQEGLPLEPETLF
jgi:hypothetical protein